MERTCLSGRLILVKKELKEIVNDRIRKQGTKCDLNDIDVSLIEDMSMLFEESEFNGDISKWNVSKVEDMSGMFYESKFNSNISRWNIDKNCNVYDMFYRCPIKEEYKPVLPE